MTSDAHTPATGEGAGGSGNGAPTDSAGSGSDPAEQAVRRYLLWLDDPTSLQDAGAIARLEAEARQARDPIARLKALSALERARAVDTEQVKLQFIVHAAAWAEANGVSEWAFRQLGVPDDVLAAAAIGRPRRGRAPRRPAAARAERAPAGAPKRRRAAGVSAADLKTALGKRAEPFTIPEVMRELGGSPLTVRKAIDELIAEGTIRALGPDPDHHARGRAPIRYGRA